MRNKISCTENTGMRQIRHSQDGSIAASATDSKK